MTVNFTIVMFMLPACLYHQDGLKTILNFFNLIPTSQKDMKAQSGRRSSNDVILARKDVLDMGSYHILLLALARSGDFEDFKTVWQAMLADGKVPDEQAYCTAFICLGAIEHKGESLKIVAEAMHADMKLRQLTFEKLLTNGRFQGNDKELLLKGIERIDKEFDPRCVYESPDPPTYNIGILETLEARDTSQLSSPVRPVLEARNEDFQDWFDRQMAMEKAVHVEIPSVSKMGNRASLPKIVQYSEWLCNSWRENIKLAIENRIQRVTLKSKKSNKTSVQMQFFLKILDTNECTDIVLNTVKEILNMSDTYSPCSKVIQKQIGLEVFKHLQLKKIVGDDLYMEKYGKVLDMYYDWFKNPENSSYWCSRECYNDILKQNQHWGPSLHEVEDEWPFALLIAIGRELMHVIIHDIMICTDAKGRLVINDEAVNISGNGKMTVIPDHSIAQPLTTCPALYKIYRSRRNMRDVEEVKPHPMLSRLFASYKHHSINFHVSELPMLVPPLPWRNSTVTGGYLLHPSELVRVSELTHMVVSYKHSLHGRLEKAKPLFDSLNVLGSTPWIVNKPVLEVLTKVFQEQEKYDSILGQLNVPRHPDNLKPPQLCPDIKQKLANKAKLQEDELKQYHDFVTQRREHNQEKNECYSMWCDLLYKLSIANHFKDQVLFFPHNIDFRGRVYPIPPYFNHMGSDLVRCLLVFAEGKPLGPNGLNWLKLHTVNLTGEKKKASVSERLEYADEIMDLILDSANDPFDGKRWWIQSEDPLQTLGACIEVRNALACDDPSQYICHLPIHQDGSCNGLQHYAALGRDILGAKFVNLVPAERPQDVYNEIATVVERKRSEDEAKGHEIAKLLNGKIKRKVVKQTVMTTVYGVTKYGAKLQIARQLHNSDELVSSVVEPSAKYLAAKTFESLNETFEASQDIQAWFTECANVISTTFLKPVEWETPLGLPVIQPYMKQTGVTLAFKNRLDLASLLKGDYETPSFYKNTTSKPNSMRQRNGFPPNFIHSLDSSHMKLTALHLWNCGVTFASVHDCYWTHPSNVEIMNKICREQFINLHSEPILETLSETFLEIYLQDPSLNIGELERARAELLFKNIPSKGTLDLNVVQDSVYFFS